MPPTNTQPSKQSNKNKLIFGMSAGAILLIVVLSVAAKWIGGIAGETIGKQSVRESAQKSAFPSGFFGVSWLMSMDECRNILPDATNTKENQLLVRRKFYDRDAIVTLTFNNDMLVIFVITFFGASTADDFERKQARLVNEYGAMSQPRQFNNYSVFSEKKVDRFILYHGLLLEQNIPMDQIIIFRSKE